MSLRGLKFTEESTMSEYITLKERADDNIVLHIHLECESKKEKEGICFY